MTEREESEWPALPKRETTTVLEFLVGVSVVVIVALLGSAGVYFALAGMLGAL